MEQMTNTINDHLDIQNENMEKMISALKAKIKENNEFIKDVKIEDNIIEIINYTLNDVLNIETGNNVNLKELNDGTCKIFKSGKITYKKDIKSNLKNIEYILLNNMSGDLTFIDKDQTPHAYAGNGCLKITLNEKFKGRILLKYLYYMLKFTHHERILNLRHGSLQKFISIYSLEKLFKKIQMTQ